MKLDIEVLCAGSVAVGVRAWGHRGRARLTAIVKASFRLAPERALELTTPTPIIEREAPRTESPVSSMRRVAETALYLGRAELLVDAVAQAPNGADVTQSKARVALARGQRVLMNKELLVVGDRKSGGDGRPLPFREMPIVYERAFGGLGHPDNPAGVGFEPRAGGPLPNILGGDGAVVEPFGFGAISTTWPRRRAKRGAVDRKQIDESPWVDLPEAFDPTYFQSAPIDQQLDDLAAGDLLLLAGLHRDIPALRVAIPTIRAAVIAEAQNGRRAPVPMRLDTIFVEPHLLRADLIFRGVLEVGVVDLQGLRVAGALEEPGQPFRFPDLSNFRETARRVVWSQGPAAAPGVPQLHAQESTFVLRATPTGEALPFTSGGARGDATRSAAARSAGTPEAPPSSGRVMGTMLLDEDPKSGAPAHPFSPSTRPAPLGPLAGEAPVGAAGPPGARRRSAPRMPAIKPAALVSSKVVPATPGIKSTLAIDEPIAPMPDRAISKGGDPRPLAPATPNAAAPIESPRPTPAPPAETAARRPTAPAPWVVAEPVPVAPQPAPPQRPILPQGPDRKAQLYRKFKG